MFDQSCPGLPPWTFESHPDEHSDSPDSTAPLDGLETSGFDNGNLSQTFRHSGWARQRRKVCIGLEDAGTSQTRQEAFAFCGSTCYVFRSRSDPSEVRLGASCCHDRFCLPCASTRSRVIAANVASYLDRGQCRFITLTLRHNDLGLASQIERLYVSFKKLRATTLWRATQRGGVAFLEVKRSRDRLSWHPHFHVLTQGKWIDGLKLANEWKTITGDSFIVDVAFVPNAEAVVRYVTKYASKPFDPTLFESPDVLVEAIIALKSRRMAINFGNWKGLQVTHKPSEEAWENIGHLETLLMATARGDAQATALVRACCGEKAEMLLRLASMRYADTLPTARPPPDLQQLTLIDVSDSPRWFDV